MSRKREYFISRGNPFQDSRCIIKEEEEKPESQESKLNYRSYKISHFTVELKVDKPVTITAVEFMGLREAAPLQIQVEIGQMVVGCWQWILQLLLFLWPWGPYSKVQEFSVTTPIVEKNERFRIILPEDTDPVKVQKDTWTEIKIKFTGPPTERFARREVTLDGHTPAKFLQPGSRQLAGIYFTLDDDMMKD